MLAEQRRWAGRISDDPILSSGKPSVKQISASTLIWRLTGTIAGAETPWATTGPTGGWNDEAR
jgi:hypothetical protein